jgi:hypothetical protein
MVDNRVLRSRLLDFASRRHVTGHGVRWHG